MICTTKLTMFENILLLCFVLFVLYLIKLMFDRRKLYTFSWQSPGPFAFPLIGNALYFFCRNEDIFEKTVNIISKYPSPMRFWLGPNLTIVISDPRQASKILLSMNFSNKGDIYKFIKIMSGNGLISGSGPKWKNDRKLMTPIFVKKNVEAYFPIFHHHIHILLEKLEQEAGSDFFNIEKYIHRCCADFVNETITGIKTDAQNGKLDDFLLAVDRMYDLIHARMIKVWLQVDWIFKLTHYYTEQEYYKSKIHGFLRNALKLNQEKLTKDETLIGRILDIKDNHPDFASEEELLHHICTLYTASEDTVTTSAAFAILVLGMHPKIQKKVSDEIDRVFGHKVYPDLDDISRLVYLEMCIKEILRLFPIGPFIIRSVSEEFHLDQWTIPKSCSVVISIYNIHRHPEFWEKPNEFYPEHFLPEAIKERPKHAYVPFSAGPRGCLGKPYAYLSLKIVVASIVRKFVIEAKGKIDDIELKTDISIRPKNRRFPVKIKLRH